MGVYVVAVGKEEKRGMEGWAAIWCGERRVVGGYLVRGEEGCGGGVLGGGGRLGWERVKGRREGWREGLRYFGVDGFDGGEDGCLGFLGGWWRWRGGLGWGLGWGCGCGCGGLRGWI